MNDFRTNNACIRFFFCVRSDVNSQTARLRECFMEQRVHGVWLLSVMKPHMHLQVMMLQAFSH